MTWVWVSCVDGNLRQCTRKQSLRQHPLDNILVLQPNFLLEKLHLPFGSSPTPVHHLLDGIFCFKIHRFVCDVVGAKSFDRCNFTHCGGSSDNDSVVVCICV